MKTITYTECLKRMYSLGRFGIKLGLNTISGILANLGSPEQTFKTIHIAGTNGKGSIASYMAAILTKAGIKTGLFTSPHLVRFNERFVINGKEVSNEDIVDAYLAVQQADTGKRKATFFELATAMALYLFSKHGVEWAVMETGMGGRLDATNIVNPDVCVITNLSLEHTEYLGNTLEEIAKEKGGIIKENTPVVCGVSQPSALAVLNKIALEKSAPLYLYNRDFQVKAGGAKKSFDYFGIKKQWNGIETRLSGEHQLDNSALALAGMELIAPDLTDSHGNTLLTEETVKNGMIETAWPGRLETILEKPLVILDGAHNLHAAQNLGSYLNREFSSRNLTLVLGILDDKPHEEMLGHFAASARRIIVTKAATSRSLDPEVLKESVQKVSNAETIIIDQVDKAVSHAVKTSSDSDVICIAGSLYVVGEARDYIISNHNRPAR